MTFALDPGDPSSPGTGYEAAVAYMARQLRFQLHTGPQSPVPAGTGSSSHMIWYSGGFASGSAVHPGAGGGGAGGAGGAGGSGIFVPAPPRALPGRRGMDGFDGADFIAGSVFGYRWWTLQAPADLATGDPGDAGRTWQPDLLRGVKDTWRPGENRAVCKPHSAAPSSHLPSEVPHIDCACVAPETRVLTADLRWVPAGDLSVGEHVMAFDEHSSGPSAGRKYRDAVVACTDRKLLPCYDVTFEDGTTVRVSSDHRWLCYSGNKAASWVRTDELRAGDLRASHVVKPFDPWEEDLSKEAGYLAAGFDGEGCLSQHPARFQNRLGFTQVDNAMLAEMERCFKMLGFGYNHGVHVRGPHEYTRVDGTPRSDTHTLTIDRKPELLRFLGTVRPLRLLGRFQPDLLGRVTMERRMRVVSKEFVGEQEVVTLGTTAGTYISEGYLSHNCGFWGYWEIQHHDIAGDGTLPVAGVMEGYGQLLTGPRGFRAGKAKIVALHLPFVIEPALPPQETSPGSGYAGNPRLYPAGQQPGGLPNPWYSHPRFHGRVISYGMPSPAEAVLRPPPPPPPPPLDPGKIAESQDRAQAWLAVMQDRLAVMYPGAEVFATLALMLAKYPPRSQYAPPPARQACPRCLMRCDDLDAHNLVAHR